MVDLSFNKLGTFYAPWYYDELYTFDLFVDPEESFFPGGFQHE